MNPQAQAMLGDEEEMIGRRAADVFPAGAELAADLRESVLVRGETLHVKEVPVGDRFWTFSCAPIQAPDGARRVLAVGQDTTQGPRAAGGSRPSWPTSTASRPSCR